MEIQYFNFLKYLIRFNRHVYLDHNATTPVSNRVRKAMERVLKRQYGNPSSFYEMGRKSASIVEQAREQVSQAIHADLSEVIFTSCASESNNAVIKSAAAHFYPKKKKIIAAPIEHPSVSNTLAYLQIQGVTIEYCQLDKKGRVLLSDLEQRIDGDIFLVCCILANNETGVIRDIQAVTRIARKHGALVLADCVQTLGKVPIDVHTWDVDYATFSAHKLYGPKGIGALYIKQGIPFTPFLHGGHQEGGLRAGTESLHNIVGFGVACKEVESLLTDAERVWRMKRSLIERLKQIKPDCVVNSTESEAECLPNTLSITFPGVENSGLMGMLDYRGSPSRLGRHAVPGRIPPCMC